MLVLALSTSIFHPVFMGWRSKSTISTSLSTISTYQGMGGSITNVDGHARVPCGASSCAKWGALDRWSILRCGHGSQALKTSKSEDFMGYLLGYLRNICGICVGIEWDIIQLGIAWPMFQLSNPKTFWSHQASHQSQNMGVPLHFPNNDQLLVDSTLSTSPQTIAIERFVCIRVSCWLWWVAAIFLASLCSQCRLLMICFHICRGTGWALTMWFLILWTSQMYLTVQDKCTWSCPLVAFGIYS